MVPRVLELKRRRRRISIEVHLVQANQNEGSTDQNKELFYEECVARISDPEKPKGNHMFGFPKGFKSATKKNDDNYSVAVDDDYDDTSLAAEFADEETSIFENTEVNKGWKTKYRVPISCVALKGTQKTTVTVEVSLSSKREVRELIFDTVEEAERFCAVVKRELSLQKLRTQKKIEASVGDIKVDNDEQITFLIEIVSGWNLPVGDLKSSDPYILVFLNGKKIHKTKHISNTRKFEQLKKSYRIF